MSKAVTGKRNDPAVNIWIMNLCSNIGSFLKGILCAVPLFGVSALLLFYSVEAVGDKNQNLAWCVVTDRSIVLTET